MILHIGFGGPHRLIWSMASISSVFNCIICGECCRGDQKVWLNPADLERLTRHLDFDGPADLFDKRIVIPDIAEYGIERPRLRFLINDLDEEGRLWGRESDPPPNDGRPVPEPDLDDRTRHDLDGESDYFRILMSQLE